MTEPTEVSAKTRADRAAEVIAYHLKAQDGVSMRVDTEPIMQEIRAAAAAAYDRAAQVAEDTGAMHTAAEIRKLKAT
jgi:hypothetical protein